MFFTPDLRSIYEKDLINNVVRRGEADLVALITREKNFENSLKLVLSDYLKLGEEKKYFRGCFDFFVCRAKQFHVFLANSPTFIRTANEFFENISEKTNNQIITFCKILEICLEFDDSIISNLDKNQENVAIVKLLENCNNLAIFDLCQLFISHDDLLNNKINLIKSTVENNADALYCICLAIKHNNNLMNIENSSTLADIMLSFAINNKDKQFYATKCYECIKILRFNQMSDNLKTKIEEYEDRADINNYAALSLYPKLAIRRINYLFESPYDSFMGRAIVDAFKKLHPQEQVDLTEQEKLTEKIVSTYGNTQHSTYVMELGQVLKKLGSASPLLSSPSWTFFARSILNQQLITMNTQYGGPLPSPIMFESIMSDSPPPVLHLPSKYKFSKKIDGSILGNPQIDQNSSSQSSEKPSLMMGSFPPKFTQHSMIRIGNGPGSLPFFVAQDGKSPLLS